jgi:protein phosphatase
LNDTWGLRKHKDGRWSWVKAPYKSGIEEVKAVYQHSAHIIGTLMFIIGGRTNSAGENGQL